MAEHIYPKKIGGRIYYYFQQTWREKIDPNDEEPVRSKLARVGHNKDCHHHLRQSV